MLYSYFTTMLITVLSYFFTLLLVRLVGKKSVSQITVYDLILIISLGATMTITVIGPNHISPVIAATIFVILTIAIDYLNMKSLWLRRLINSEAIVVIEKGNINNLNLRRSKMTMDELNMQLRQKDVFNISDVESAVYETNGKLSVLLKSEKQPLTPFDMNISTGYKGLTTDIIIDGNIMNENLLGTNHNENWLMDNLRIYGVNHVQDVFYAGLDTSGNLYVSRKLN